MRIIIEISDAEMIKASAQSQVITAVTPQVAKEAEAPVSAMPPPELLQVATSLGAESAGPAPAIFSEADITEYTSSQTFSDMDEEEVDSEDAGPAPSTMPEPEFHDEDA